MVLFIKWFWTYVRYAISNGSAIVLVMFIDENLRFKWIIQSILAFFCLTVKKNLGLYEHNDEDQEEEDWRRWIKVKKLGADGSLLETINMQSNG